MTSPGRLVASVPDAIAAVRRGDRRVLARLLSALEDGTPAGSQVMAYLRSEPTRAEASVLAITGAPGVGKSTLVSALARIATDGGARVAVLAVDPSSQVTGGAVLGDRIRMMSELGDEVYIRSFANRGVVGGLARVVPDAVELVAAGGYTLVIIETVGVGQSEIDVARHADITAVVLTPNLGDEVQAVKAGLMEIADVYIVNKCDLPGAGQAANEVRTSTRLRHVGQRDVPVLKASATTGEQLPAVWETLDALLRAASAEPAAVRRRRVASRVDEFADATVEHLRRLTMTGIVEPGSVLGQVIDGRLTTTDAVTRLGEWLTAEPS